MSPLHIPKHPYTISRRDFLKLGGLALATLFPLRRDIESSQRQLSRINFNPAQAVELLDRRAQIISPDQQGRVLDAYVHVYDAPSFTSNRVNTYWRDRVLPITNLTIGSEQDSHNLVWYRISEEGYVHSGAIQPVRTLVNQPNNDIPHGGALGEVTVPFTDARWAVGREQPVAYRFYYETTYWVLELEYDMQGEAWYHVLDDKWEYTYYVPAQHLRLIPQAELAPISPAVPTAGKRVEVHIPEQVLMAYEWDEPIFMARVATGAVFSNGDFSTPTGYHMIFHKRPSRHMARGNLAANGYDLPGVPWNSYITEEGIAFHGTYWHNNFGRPRSHGCINLTPQAARWLYLWTLPSVPHDQQSAYERSGTVVDIIG